jgi:hypothetical protein
MKYTHPAHYTGLKYDSKDNQKRIRVKVEAFCLKCDKFMRKQHDFRECKPDTCPFGDRGYPLFNMDNYIKCDVEEGVKTVE